MASFACLHLSVNEQPMELLCLWQCSKQTISLSLTSFRPLKCYWSSVHPVLFMSIAAALLQTLITFSFLLNFNVLYIQESSQNSHIPLNQNSQLLTFYYICPTVPCSIYIYTHIYTHRQSAYIHVHKYMQPMEYSLPGSSVLGILQSRILEWVAIPFSRGSSWPWDQNQVSHIARQILYHLIHQGNPKYTHIHI